MNYHLIKNNFEKIEYKYDDQFEIIIYYLSQHDCQINVKRIDAECGWGLNLEIKIFDLLNNNYYDIIMFGSSLENYKIQYFKTNIKLEYDEINKTTIPKLILPRNEYLINNNYDVIYDKNIFIDLHIVIYYINEYSIKIIIRRLDEETGWDLNFKIFLYDCDVRFRKEIININNCDINYKYLFKDTKVKINYNDNDYIQEIPKIIFQTGYSNKFKNILHFNSIITFIELNPEYTYIYYDDYDSRQYLRENFSDEINYSFDLLVPGAFKADLLRYCFLYKNGGCYFDCKQILRVSIRFFLENNKTLGLCNDVIDDALLNANIFTIKNNLIIEKTIKDCIYNIINKLGTNALDITGPIFFYKSIKNFISKDNLLLQNNRPPNDFNDFCNDYSNNNITLIKNNKIVISRFYKNYYNDYLNTNHYGKLFNNNEIYYKNIQYLEKFKICVYPNKFNDKFFFNLVDDKILIIKRTDLTEGWNFNLKILIIMNNYKEYLIEIGNSTSNSKKFELNIF
jgi:mannosyltransferase OCH1-like enzyme